MDRHHSLAVKALLVDFLSGYPSLVNAGEGTVDAYARPVVSLSLEAIGAAIQRFVHGDVPGQNTGFPPNATEFYLEAQRQEGVRQSSLPASKREPPDGYRLAGDGRSLIVPIGKPVPDGWDGVPDGTTVDYGRGSIQLGGLTRREAQVIDDLAGTTPDGKNFALLSLAEKRREIARYLPSPVAA